MNSQDELLRTELDHGFLLDDDSDDIASTIYSTYLRSFTVAIQLISFLSSLNILPQSDNSTQDIPDSKSFKHLPLFAASSASEELLLQPTSFDIEDRHKIEFMPESEFLKFLSRQKSPIDIQHLIQTRLVSLNEHDDAAKLSR